MAGYFDSDWISSAADATGWGVPDIYAQPNGGAVPVDRPSVDTGGADWGSWFDRLVGAGLAIRSSNQADARVTGYPTFDGLGLSYAGQPANGSGGAGANLMPLLLLAGIAFVGYKLLKG